MIMRTVLDTTPIGDAYVLTPLRYTLKATFGALFEWTHHSQAHRTQERYDACKKTVVQVVEEPRLMMSPRFEMRDPRNRPANGRPNDVPRHVGRVILCER